MSYVSDYFQDITSSILCNRKDIICRISTKREYCMCGAVNSTYVLPIFKQVPLKKASYSIALFNKIKNWCRVLVNATAWCKGSQAKLVVVRWCLRFEFFSSPFWLSRVPQSLLIRMKGVSENICIGVTRVYGAELTLRSLFAVAYKKGDPLGNTIFDWAYVLRHISVLIRSSAQKR